MVFSILSEFPYHFDRIFIDFEQELYDTVYDDVILPGLSQHIGYVFEQVCIQYLKRINGKKTLPFTFFDIGRWWGNNKIKRCEEEIDILAVDNKSNALFGECKWRNEPIDIPILKSLVEKNNLLPYSNKYYILFSKSGFTIELLKSIVQSVSLIILVLHKNAKMSKSRCL